MYRFTLICAVGLFTLLSGCGPNTLYQATERGGRILSPQDQQQQLAERQVRLESSSFDAKVLFHANGSLTAKSPEGEQDKGKWIFSDQQLCISFSRWLYGDQHCYTLVETEPNQLLLFSPSGAFALKATLLGLPDTPVDHTRGMTDNPAQNDKQPVPQDILVVPPSIPVQELKQTVAHLAMNCPGCDLSGTDLKGATLIGADLSKADLSHTNLSDANLRRAHLQDADLRNAQLLRANLAGADLRDADLSGANLHGANLIHADLTGADLTNTDLSNTHTESTKGLPQR